GVAVAAAVRVAPEGDRHGRHGRGDHQLGQLADHDLAVLVERLGVHAEAGTAHLAEPHRLFRAALHDAGAHVGAAAAHVDQHVVAELRVEPPVALGGQGAADHTDLPDPGQVEVPGGFEPGLAA